MAHDKHPAKGKAPATFKPRDTRRDAVLTRAHTRRVFVLRRLLPLLIAFVLIALIVWPMATAQRLTSLVANSIPNLVIENLHLKGMDAKNQPYSLTAARAFQAADLKNTIDLEQPKGDIQLASGAWIAGTAQSGRYDQANKNLFLSGDVHVFHDLGYQFSTSEALVDLNTSMASGSRPVLVQGSFGEIRGAGFQVTGKGSVIVIKGPATARLQLQDGKPSGKTGETNPAAPK